MDTNKKGNIGLGKVVSDIVESGFAVFLPFTDTTCVDVIVGNNALMLRRLQVKYREAKQNVVTIPFCSVVNGVKIPIDFIKIDGWAVYTPIIDKVFYLLKSDVNITKKSYSFRIAPSKVKQKYSLDNGMQFLGVNRLF